MKEWKIVAGCGALIFVGFVGLMGCGASSAAKHEATRESIIAAYQKKYLDQVKAKFDAMTPKDHMDAAHKAMAAGQWDEARRQAEGLPVGEPRRLLEAQIFRAQDRTDEREDYGASPDTSVVRYYISQRLWLFEYDAESFEIVDVSMPVHDTIEVKGQTTNCWRVGFTVRERKNGILVSNYGSAWVKGDNCLKCKLDS